jgi:nitronate monooxygenase
MWNSNALTQRLGLRAPIIQGPFGGGMSSVKLAATVSEAGGLGSFGAHHLSGADIRQVAAAIRLETSRPFALNLWIPFEQSMDPPLSDAEFSAAVGRLQPYLEELGVAAPPRPARFSPAFEEQIEAVLEARPAVFSFVFGIPSAAILRACRERDIVTVGAATTADEAVALERADVDMIVATGFEAGGHRPSFLRPAEQSLMGTLALVPQVVDEVKVPVIAAGGIADGRGVAAALALGAQAAQLGTAFLACEESAASELHRQVLFSPAARLTALTRAYSGRLARGVRNRMLDELEPHQSGLPVYPVQNWLTAQFKPAAVQQQRRDLMSLWSGQSAPLLRHRNAAQLFTDLVSEAGAILDKLHER